MYNFLYKLVKLFDFKIIKKISKQFDINKKVKEFFKG